MKYLIASDIHGSALYCEQMLRLFERQGCGRMILLGDFLYHGPRNALPEGYDPAKTAAMLNEKAPLIHAVRGNCDAEVDQMMLRFPIMADYALMPAGSRQMVITHGHLFDGGNPPPHSPGDILLFGHIHVQKHERCGDMILLNPGSVSIPKENSERACIVLEGTVFRWLDLTGREFYRWDSAEEPAE